MFKANTHRNGTFQHNLSMIVPHLIVPLLRMERHLTCGHAELPQCTEMLQGGDFEKWEFASSSLCRLCHGRLKYVHEQRIALGYSSHGSSLDTPKILHPE